MSLIPFVKAAPKFNFDDNDMPIHGVVLDEAKEKAKLELWHKLIHNAAAINVAALGFSAIQWWIHGGYMLMWMALARWVPGILHMALTGQP